MRKATMDKDEPTQLEIVEPLTVEIRGEGRKLWDAGDEADEGTIKEATNGTE